MLRSLDIDLVYQPTIPGPPQSTDDLYKLACQGDKATIDHWRTQWVSNYKAAKDRFGTFYDKSFGELHGRNRYRPAIVIGSGPSLKYSLDALRENQKMKYPLLTVSCLHNFGYFIDEGIEIDYYLSLDAGDIVISDVSEGRKQAADIYWEATKGKKLLAYIGSHPSLWEKWQGEIYLFNSLIPDQLIREECEAIEPMRHYISSGGNALGACMYAAKAVMSSTEIIYVGADFCFSWDNQFHAYKTAYDKLGNALRWVDVYGIPRWTWQSYVNFKFWFDRTACVVPGRWVNASEGLLGAYRDGNIAQFNYCDLHQAIYPYKCTEVVVEEEFKVGPGGNREVVSSSELGLEDHFKDSRVCKPLTLF